MIVEPPGDNEMRHRARTLVNTALTCLVCAVTIGCAEWAGSAQAQDKITLRLSLIHI